MAHRTKDIKSIDKQALGIDVRPSLIVLTGFLGSGKTSFLRNFIEYQVQMNRFVAVIQNEIGAVGLDGKLMEDDVTVTEMDEGCVCCSLIGNLKSAIAQILSEFQPDYIVLETTGLANPFNLLGDLEELSEKVRFDSVTTVVDAAGATATIDEYAVARDQVRAADILLINKIDLVSKPALGRLRDCLAILNPRAALVTATQGNIPPGLLYGTDPLDEVGNFSEKRSRAVPAAPRPTHRQEGVQSLKITFDAPLDRDAFLRSMKEKVSPTVLRIKGILEFTDASGPCVFQYVSGRYELSPFTNPSVPDRFLVFIGTSLDSTSIHTALGGRVRAYHHA
jgi:G3E family GTPase